MFLAGFAQAIMYSLRVLGHKHNVNFKVSSTCFNVDKKNRGGKQGVFSHQIRETYKTMQNLLYVDPFLMLEVHLIQTEPI